MTDWISYAALFCLPILWVLFLGLVVFRVPPYVPCPPSTYHPLTDQQRAWYLERVLTNRPHSPHNPNRGR